MAKDFIKMKLKNINNNYTINNWNYKNNSLTINKRLKQFNKKITN